MNAGFSPALLRAYVHECVKKSRSLGPKSFQQRNIAERVFCNNNPKNAKSRFSNALSGRETLTRHTVSEILKTCRVLLETQIDFLGIPNRRETAIDYERSICRAAGLSVEYAAVDDFKYQPGLDHIRSSTELGIPSITNWDSLSCDFFNELQIRQQLGYESVESLLCAIDQAETIERRFDFLQMVLNVSQLNHPGTQWHDAAHDKALRGAESAGLFAASWSYSTCSEVRLRALELWYHLVNSRHIPTLDSPTNYARYAIAGRQMPQQVYSRYQDSVENLILVTNSLVEMDPHNQVYRRYRVGALSFKARLLIVSGGGGALREADRCHRASVADIEKTDKPYGFLYPIYKNIVSGKVKKAISQTENAASITFGAGDLHSAAAFNSLLLPLSAMNDGQATADAEIRSMARRALQDPTILYKHSHVVDFAAVRRLLVGRPRK